MRVFLTGTSRICTTNAVDTLEKCRESVDMIKNEIPNARFGRSDNWSVFPKGCFLYVNDDVLKDQVFFNEHSTGSPDGNGRHICEETGNI